MPERHETGSAAFTLPEFTRSLRSFASVGALPSADHELFFAPLIAARRAAARVESIEGQLAAFDAPRLRHALEEAIAVLCAARAPKEGPERRAIAARADQLARPAFAALDRMERATAALRAARERERAAPWRAWVAEVRSLFESADRFWSAAQAALPPAPTKARRARKGTLRAIAVLSLGAAPAPDALGAQHVALRVSGVRAESLLARGFDVVGTEPGAVVVVADPAERARLEGLGWRGTVLLAPGAPAERALGLQVATTPRVYRSYDDQLRGVRAFLDSLARNNPRVSVDTIGPSYELRPMLAVKIGPAGDSPARPNVLFMATYHAREWAATEMALRLITYLASATSANVRVDSLLATRDIWVIPVANPDGYQYTFTSDRLWRKTRSPQANGAVGVDMNRNHRQNWGQDGIGSSPTPSSDIYRGPSPASEVEIRNIESFHAAHPPVVSVSYHSYAGLLLYPPGNTYGQLPADLPVYRTLAGTNLRSAVTDRLPGSTRTFYSPSSGWMLYPTNGEYNDWASAQYGAISFTPEVTSGYMGGTYYGFEFADDSTQLRMLFDDNLPFALDVIESARDPFAYVSPTTLGKSDRVVLESISPDVRVTVPAAAAPEATVRAGSVVVPFRVDSAAGGRFTRRLVTGGTSRPPIVTVNAGGQTASFSVRAYHGAERTESGWTATQARLDSAVFLAGRYSWFLSGAGDLRSPVVNVPADADTVSLLFWTRYAGSGFEQSPFAQVLLSTDAGATFQPALRLQGSAPAWYPERLTVGGVRNKSLVFDFAPAGLPWHLDEIAIVTHASVTTSTTAGQVALRPSENPVRRGVVYFAWPFATPDGDIQAFDFTGRLLWKVTVANGATTSWDLHASGVPNGVYVVVARSGGRTVQLKLYVARNGS